MKIVKEAYANPILMPSEPDAQLESKLTKILEENIGLDPVSAYNYYSNLMPLVYFVLVLLTIIIGVSLLNRFKK